MARPGLPRAYFDEIALQIDRLPEGVVRGVPEPGALRLTRTVRAQRRAARMLYRALTEAENSRLWIEVEPEIRLPGDLLGVPEMAGWILPGDLTELLPQSLRALAPDLCCKIITADTAKSYRASRLPLYARAGVRWFWLIDPTTRSLEALEITPTDSIPLALAKNDDEPVLPPFHRPLPLASLWLP
ncbi:MAG: Uma2 family endonuclease [Polyangiaceae bacterium]|nr:Uma2 family endonuclease [Polyangiaceae bacterium]